MANVKDISKGFATGLHWSPDGKTLAFKARKQAFLFHSQDGRITKIDDEVVSYFWSPDSKWISYNGFRFVKTRPEGVLWEMDVEEVLAKLGH